MGGNRCDDNSLLNDGWKTLDYISQPVQIPKGGHSPEACVPQMETESATLNEMSHALVKGRGQEMKRSDHSS